MDHEVERPPATIRAWFERRRFLVLLVALLLLLVLHPLLAEGGGGARWLYHLFLSAVFLVAFLVLFERRRHRLAAVLLGLPTLLGAWAGYASPGLPLAVAFHGCAAAFLGFTVAVILRATYAERGLSVDSVLGAFCGYLTCSPAWRSAICTASPRPCGRGPSAVPRSSPPSSATTPTATPCSTITASSPSPRWATAT
jgi:hypothetical protein